MKVFISVDMEGGSGISSAQHMREGGYERMRRLLTHDVNAAIEGAYDAGASEVLVTDAHGNMTNLMIEELDERAMLLSGSNKHLCQMEGIDETFDVVFFIGYHAHEGNGDAVMNHTIAGMVVSEIKRNGVVVGETAINAGIAGHYHVPVGLVVGDNVVCAEARSFLGDIETVEVKQAVDRYAAILKPLKQTQKEIRAAAMRAVKRCKSMKSHTIAAPIEFQLTTKLTNHAHMACLFPTVKRIAPKVVVVQSNDYLEAYKQLWGCLIIAMACNRGIFG